MWTSHRQKLGEMRGKASNVDWAAREAAKEFRRLGETYSNACASPDSHWMRQMMRS